jgi:hypothetical protein
VTTDEAVAVASTALRAAWHWITSAQFLTGAGAAAALLLVLGLLWWRRGQLQTVTVGLPFGLGSMSYNTTPHERVVAWKLYVHLATRKAAIPFDETHDVITEVYDSLFSLFGITRDLLLDLPPGEFQRADGVASLMLRVQNDGVRPHLTRWQADFRRWWERATQNPDHATSTPQEIQREYPRYTALVADSKITNTELSKFADELLTLARGKKGRRRAPTLITPQPPGPEQNLLPEPPEEPEVPPEPVLPERSDN